MDIGTYAGASGGVLAELRLEITNNNLANVNTPGFKRHILVSKQRAFEDTLTSKIAGDAPFAKGDFDRTPGVSSAGTFVDFSMGPIRSTGNDLDVALRKENEFFAIQTDDGEQYTRAGNFSLSVDGRLVTQDGKSVLGDGGPIEAAGGTVKIADSGDVLVNGESVGRLKIVRFDNVAELRPKGSTLYAMDGNQQGVAVDEPALSAGSLEMSNVSAIQSMVDLIKANRGFQMYEKSVKSIDEMNQQSVSRIGKR